PPVLVVDLVSVRGGDRWHGWSPLCRRPRHLLRARRGEYGSRMHGRVASTGLATRTPSAGGERGLADRSDLLAAGSGPTAAHDAAPANTYRWYRLGPSPTCSRRWASPDVRRGRHMLRDDGGGRSDARSSRSRSGRPLPARPATR